jgi:dCMP deaminase
MSTTLAIASPSIPDVDEYYMEIALAVRKKANCRGSRVGAVIVQENRIVSTGYNGTPEGMTNCLDNGCYRCANKKEYPSGTGYDLCICVHAEQNALLSAARFGIRLEGAIAYTTIQPCFGCMKEMLQVRIQRVHYLHAWQPTAGPKKAEYDKLSNRFPGGVKRIQIADPDGPGVVPQAIQSADEVPTDEHGHQTQGPGA